MAPTRNDEYLLYQTLVGTWPVEPLNQSGWDEFQKRITQYMIKAIREAKQHTSWANIHGDYETAMSDFIDAILDRASENPFVADFSEFEVRIIRAGLHNSLSQCLLKLTSPGVPDVYQGNELLQYALVDPDNRRPVDYEARKQLLATLQSARRGENFQEQVRHLATNLEDGRAKLYLTWKTLQTRRDQPQMFEQGSYIPLKVKGPKAAHVVAFAREFERRRALIAVPRLCATLMGERESLCHEEIWRDTTVEAGAGEAGCYHNVFTGECIPVSGQGAPASLPAGKLFSMFPVALLLNEMAGCEPEPTAGS
jgi:(1->4)-alpha-D-glucan 1-alpha-D-glucosylmutase